VVTSWCAAPVLLTLNPVGQNSSEVLGCGKVGSIAEVGYVFQERHQGKSKVTSKQYVLSAPPGTVAPLLLGGLDDSVSVWISSWSVHPLWFEWVGQVFVDMALLYLLSDPTTLGWPLTRSKSLLPSSQLYIISCGMTDGLLLISPVSSRDGVNAGGGFEIQHHLPRLVLNVLVNLVFNFLLPTAMWQCNYDHLPSGISGLT